MTQPPMTPNYPGMPQPQPTGGGGLAITSLVLGIIAVVLFCVPVLPWILGLIAIVLGVIAMGQAGDNRPTGQAKAGLILGIIALVLAIGFWAAAGRGVHWFGNKFSQQIQDAAKKAQQQQDEYQRQHSGATSQP